MNTYYIGGSPCSGKSTVAEILSQKYDLYYFKVDDFLDKYTRMGASKGCEICQKQDSMSAEQIWMREPSLQCIEELKYYQEIFEFVLHDKKQIQRRGIITEGVAYLPQLMKQINVPINRYISVTPTKEFQVFHYRKREWVPYVLEGCSDTEKAFSNWMERDSLFAEELRRQCHEEKYVSVLNDGNIELEEMVSKIAIHFGLEA